VILNLRKLKLDHLRLDVKLGEKDWREKLDRGLELVRQIDSHLEVAWFLDSTQFGIWAEELTRLRSDQSVFARFLVFHPLEKVTPESFVHLAQESSFGNGYPVLKVFAAIQSCSSIHQTRSAFSLNIAALGMTYNDGTRSVLLANMSGSSQTISIELCDGKRLQFHLEPESVRILGEGEII